MIFKSQTNKNAKFPLQHISNYNALAPGNSFEGSIKSNYGQDVYLQGQNMFGYSSHYLYLDKAVKNFIIPVLKDPKFLARVH